MSFDLFIHTPFINLEDRELCIFLTTSIRALVIGIKIFLVCSVVAALTDLPHQKRIFLEPYFFCQFSVINDPEVPDSRGSDGGLSCGGRWRASPG